MLAKKQKLNSTEHRYVLKKGKSIHTKHFSLHVLPIAADQSKCAVVVSKKVCRKATQRNTLKRKIFDRIKNIYPHILPGFHFIIRTRKNANLLGIGDLNEEVSELFSGYTS